MANTNNIDASSFTEGNDILVFSRLSAAVRNHVGEDADGAEIDALVTSILERNVALDLVKLDAPLSGNPVERRLFDFLLSHFRIRQIDFPATLEATCIPALLRRALPLLENKPGVPCFILEVYRMNATEAQEIFGLVQRFTSCCCLSIILTGNSDSIFSAISQCIRESAAMTYLTIGVVGDARLQKDTFRTLCEAIGESSSLEELYLQNLIVQEEHVGIAIDHVANAIESSATLNELNLNPVNCGTFSMERLCQALSRTTAVNNFDLRFRTGASSVNGFESLKITRGPSPFKRVLSQNVPLGLWPRILAKAGTSTQEDSHSPLDFVFLLAKEKNDVLFRGAAQLLRTEKLSGRKRKARESSAT